MRVKITPREKGETRFARSTFPEEKWGLLVVCVDMLVDRCYREEVLQRGRNMSNIKECYSFTKIRTLHNVDLS